jgi:hypothetical protein
MNIYVKMNRIWNDNEDYKFRKIDSECLPKLLGKYQIAVVADQGKTLLLRKPQSLKLHCIHLGDLKRSDYLEHTGCGMNYKKSA